jgi:N-acetylglutamate synthase-like GNAT family acetyltransferase
MSIFDLSEQPHYLSILAAWHQQEWAHLNPGSSLEKRIEKMQAYLEDGLVPSTFIYQQHGQLAGSAAIVVCDMDTHPEITPWLASVFVAPQFRRQGIGAQLVRHVMLQAKQAGIPALHLFTPDQVAFYQRLGWSIVTKEVYCETAVSLMRVGLNDPSP